VGRGPGYKVFARRWWGKHPRLQIVTIEELLQGAEIDYPPAKHVDVTYKKAQRVQRKDAEQAQLEFDE
jgi:hypothetical protein